MLSYISFAFDTKADPLDWLGGHEADLSYAASAHSIWSKAHGFPLHVLCFIEQSPTLLWASLSSSIKWEWFLESPLPDWFSVEENRPNSNHTPTFHWLTHPSTKMGVFLFSEGKGGHFWVLDPCQWRSSSTLQRRSWSGLNVQELMLSYKKRPY